MTFRNLNMFIDRHPGLFFFFHRNGKLAYLLTGAEKDIVIEGFPRSGNTFACLAFSRIQSKEVRIAHHLHAAAQIVKGIQLEIPVVLLIRHPRDAVSSLAVYDRTLGLKHLLKKYVNFYGTLMSYKEKVVVAPFDEVIGNYENVIRSINNKFKTNFDNYSAQTPLNTGEIFQSMEPFAKESDTGRINESIVARPSHARARAKAEIMEELKAPRYRRLLERAEEIYGYFTA